MLRHEGLEVQVAPDGPSALAAVPTFKPDVVLLDIGLPGMDGWEIVRQLKTDKPLFIVAVTGYGQTKDLQRSKEAGIDLHVLKPADPKHLLGLLKRFEQLVH